MVRLHMGLPTDFLIKLFITQFTLILFNVTVYPHMLSQCILSWKCFSAHIARKQSLIRMNHHVPIQNVLGIEFPFTTWTFKMLACMHYSKMRSKLITPLKNQSAFRTGIYLLRNTVSYFHMAHFQFPVTESFAANRTEVLSTIIRNFVMFSLVFGRY